MSKRSACYCCAVLCGVAFFLAVTATAQPDNPIISIDKAWSVHADTTFQIHILFTPGSAPATDLGYLNLLIHYDTAAVTLLSVSAGSSLAACGWESFSWGAGASANCDGSPCPPGVVRIIAQADLNNGPPGPSCLLNDVAELAVLTFQSSADTSIWECQFSSIDWVWFDCGDNVAMESVDSDSVFVSQRVWDFDGTNQITQDLALPSFYGSPSTCVPFGITGKVTERAIDFQRGGLDYLCIDSIDARGDINLNGIAYEIADWVLLSRYFVSGLSVFSNPVVQSTASDCNANGVELELNDLVYLHRVVTGDALPFPRPTVTPAATAIVTQDATVSSVRIQYPGRITTAWFVFGGNIQATCAFSTHVAAYDDSLLTPYTRVLVYETPLGDLVDFPPMDTNRVIIGYTGNGTLLHAEVSSDGVEYIPVTLNYNNVPSCCQQRGNVNGYGGIDIADLTTLVGFLFQGTFPPPPCPEETDVDGSGGSSPITVSDITFLVNYLFQGGTAPPACP